MPNELLREESVIDYDVKLPSPLTFAQALDGFQVVRKYIHD